MAFDVARRNWDREWQSIGQVYRYLLSPLFGCFRQWVHVVHVFLVRVIVVF